MRKLTRLSAAYLILATCFSTAAYAQTAGSAEYPYYAGPLDSKKMKFVPANHGPLDNHGPQDDVFRSTNRGPLDAVPAARPAPRRQVAQVAQPQQRVASIAPSRQQRYRGITTAVVGTVRRTQDFELPRENFSLGSVVESQAVAPPNPVRVNPTQAYPTQAYPTQANPAQINPIQANPTQAYPTQGNPQTYPAQANPTDLSSPNLSNPGSDGSRSGDAYRTCHANVHRSDHSAT